MSQPPRSESVSRWRRPRTWVALAAGLVLGGIVAFVILSVLQNRSARYPGGLQIIAPPGSRLFVGEVEVGQGSVFLPWEGFFGEGDGAGQPDLLPVVWLPENAPLVGGGEDVVKLLLASMGPAEPLLLISQQNGGGYAGRLGREMLSVVGWEVLVQRDEHRLDHVLILKGRLTSRRNPQRQFYAAIRARKPAGDAGPLTTYRITDDGITVTDLNPFGLGSARNVVEWRLSASPLAPKYGTVEEGTRFDTPGESP